MSAKLPEPGALAFFSFLQNYSFPDGVGNGLRLGPAFGMVDIVTHRLDQFLNQDAETVRVALDVDGSVLKSLIILDATTLKTHVVPMSITPRLAHIGDQQIFLGSFRSAGLVVDAIMREVRAAIEPPVEN